jgi:hypothetical protein
MIDLARAYHKKTAKMNRTRRETKVNGKSVEKRKKKVQLRLNESTSKEKQSVTPLKLSVLTSKIENAVGR